MRNVKCSFCGRPDGKIVIRKEVGSTREHHVACNACAELLGLDDPDNHQRPTVRDLLSGVFDSAFEREGSDRCPECGQTLREIRRTSQVGCPHCYIAFQSVIADLLKRDDRSVQHTGSYPARLVKYRDFFEQRESLRDRLDRALDHEMYEEAARIRDQLNTLHDTRDDQAEAAPEGRSADAEATEHDDEAD